VQTTNTRFDSNLRERLRQLAIQAGITPDDAARRAHIPIATVQSWFKPSVRLNPTVQNLRAYCAACHSSLGELFDFTLSDQPRTSTQDLLRVIERATRNPNKRHWVESFVEMLRHIERGST
jgi:transcriptional regulator with XRE-family HTH domain